MTSKRHTRLLSLASAAGLLLQAAGCIHIDSPPGVRGNGIYASENRTDFVVPFDEVSLDSSANVEITVDPTLAAPAMVVSADENLLPIIKTQVRGDCLHISATRSHSSRNGVLVEIVTPSLSAVYLRGSGNIDTRGIEAERFLSRISGSGQVTLSGRAREVDFAVTGSGSIVAADLEAEVGRANIGGSGNISLRAREEATLTIGGSGAIACYGDPARVSRNVGGSGYIALR